MIVIKAEVQIDVINRALMVQDAKTENKSFLDSQLNCR